MSSTKLESQTAYRLKPRRREKRTQQPHTHKTFIYEPREREAHARLVRHLGFSVIRHRPAVAPSSGSRSTIRLSEVVSTRTSSPVAE